ncbi:MAG TPA: LacI family DNA-binding transcriptional regulator, partial [Ktedonobacteraceae bacterium]|nr:LacI family DNA-binding transcriptional regulator [Ktedonobacteraceae bacterium]
MEKEQRRVTSEDVARASGVSRATVSYVLNNDPRQSIPSETRERVLKVARELGYRPFTAARILRAGYSRLVLVVLQFEIVDPAMARSLKDLETALAKKGFSLIWYVGVHTALGHIHPSANLTPAVIVSLVDESDAEISQFLREFNVPILSMNNETTRGLVGKAQVSYLADRGYQRMVFAAPERNDIQWLAQARLDGARQGCVEHKLEPPIVQVVPASREGARRAIMHLLKQHSPPIGMCCYNDEVALAVLAACSDLAFKVPDSLAVIGCDDIPLSQLSIP